MHGCAPQAMDVIMGRVKALTEPLRSAEDCDCVRGEGVGKDNVDKLKEIVRTGAYRRNEQLAQDPHHQAIKVVGLTPKLGPPLAQEHAYFEQRSILAQPASPSL